MPHTFSLLLDIIRFCMKAGPQNVQNRTRAPIVFVNASFVLIMFDYFYFTPENVPDLKECDVIL